MKNEYRKPKIEINYWIVKSEHIEKLYNFFIKRFPTGDIEIKLEVERGHNKTYETFEEYLEDTSNIFIDSEVVSKISILGSDRFNTNVYKQMWVDITFGKYSGVSMHIIGGDTDGGYKDWIEGSYAELNRFREIFEVTDQKIIEILHKEYNDIVFDSTGEIEKKIIDSLKPVQNRNEDKIVVVLEDKKDKTGIFTVKKIILGVLGFILTVLGTVIAGRILFGFGWN